MNLLVLDLVIELKGRTNPKRADGVVYKVKSRYHFNSTKKNGRQFLNV